MSAQREVGRDPLVEALQRKVNHQADRIDDLESSLTELRSDYTQLKRELAEVQG